jgi:hypothetical protein
VRLEGGRVLKYIGLLAPPLQSPVLLLRQYGKESLDFNRSLVEGKTIQIEWGFQLKEDMGSRLLGYVFLEDGTFVNKEILAAGHAKATIKAPNLKYAPLFRQTDLEAHRKKLGLWRAEPDNPYLKHDYIGEKNTKIYYLPNSPELDSIPQANIVTFNSRVEAKAAGYKPCFNCKEAGDDLY